MILLVVFAFLAGVVTILSPCILPILPIVLSGSLIGGKRRPLGIIAGFIGSFTFFTLFLSTIVKLTGLSADSLRQFAVVVVFAFGVSMLLSKFQVWMEKLFSKVSSLLSRQTGQQGGSDFVGGTFIGVSLGLVWAPCVGPILASIISLALTGTVTGSAVIITLAYSIGTAIPMLAITYGGRELLGRVPWLISNSEKIQKAFGVLMIIAAMAIFFNLDRKFQTYILEAFPNYGVGLTKVEDNPLVNDALNNLRGRSFDKAQDFLVEKSQRGQPMNDIIDDMVGKAPEFIVGGQWLNLTPRFQGETLEPPTIASLRGKVVLVDFWTYTCINCIRTLPYLKNWHSKYKDKGLVIVGVHTPEFEFEKDTKNVQKAIKDFGIEYPVMQDNDYATWRAYDNHYWPAKYLIDKNGKIRYTHFGEGDYDETEKKIQELLAETGAQISEAPDNPKYAIRSRTPELYLGYDRIQYLISPEQIKSNAEGEYTAPANISPSTFAYTGKWIIGAERAMPKKGSTLILNFDAAEVFLVMRPTKDSGKIKISLDGASVGKELAGEDVAGGTVTVDTDRLYKLIKLSNPGVHILKLEFFNDNVELYAFTFG